MNTGGITSRVEKGSTERNSITSSRLGKGKKKKDFYNDGYLCKKQLSPFQKCTYKDQDFCLVDDNLDSDSVVYIDLTENPERFTGYAGASAARVWKAIYEENCFNIVHRMTEGCETCNNIMNLGQPKLKTAKPVNPFAQVPKNKAQLNQFLNDLAEESDGGEDSDDEVCLEKRVYYRLISGLHSSISIHICDEWFNRETGVWVRRKTKISKRYPSELFPPPLFLGT